MSKEKKVSFKEKAKVFAESYLSTVKDFSYFLESDIEPPKKVKKVKSEDPNHPDNDPNHPDNDEKEERRAKSDHEKREKKKKEFLKDPKNKEIQDKTREEKPENFSKRKPEEEHEEAKKHAVNKNNPASPDHPEFQKMFTAEPGAKSKNYVKRDAQTVEKEDKPEDIETDKEKQAVAVGPRGPEGLIPAKKPEKSRVDPSDGEPLSGLRDPVQEVTKQEMLEWLRKRNISKEQYEASPQKWRKMAIDSIKKARALIDDPDKVISGQASRGKRLRDVRRDIPKDPEKIASRAMNDIKPVSGKTQTLGRKISDKIVIDKVQPYLLSLITKYKNFKLELMNAGYDPMKPINDEMEALFNAVENVLGMPATDPSDSQSMQMFKQKQQSIIGNPLQIVPPQFLQSTLQSYPFENNGVASDVESHLIKTFKQHGMEDVDSKKIASLLPHLKVGQFVKLLQYFKEHANEIEKSERSLRSPSVEVGNNGERGITTGNIRGDESGIETAEDFHGQGDSSNISDEELGFAKDEPEEALEADSEAIDDPSLRGERNFFDDLHGIADKAEWNDVSNIDSAPGKEKIFSLLQAQNAYDRIFNDHNDLERVQSADGKLPASDLTAKASKFLEAIVGNGTTHEGDENLEEIVVRGISRQFARKQIEREVSSRAGRIAEEPNQQLRNQKFDELKSEYNKDTLGAIANKYKVLARHQLLAMVVHRNGRVTLSDPTTLKLSGDRKEMAEVIYNAMNPRRLGEKNAFKDFLVNKADDVNDRIIAIIDEKVRGEQEIWKKREQARAEKEERERLISPAGFDQMVKQKTGARDLNAQISKLDQPGFKPGTGEKPNPVKDAIRGVGFKPGKGERPPIVGIKPGFAKPAPIDRPPVDYQDYLSNERGEQRPEFVDKAAGSFDRIEKEKEAAKKARETAKASGNAPAKKPSDLAAKKEPKPPGKSETEMGGPRGKNKEERSKSFLDKLRSDKGVTLPKKDDPKPQKESFMRSVSTFFISEGFKMNSTNIKNYLVSLYKLGSINRSFLEEMLVSLSDVKKTDQGWEEVTSKKASKKLRG